MKLIVLVILLMSFFSCNTKTAEKENGIIANVKVSGETTKKTEINDGHNAKNALDWVGTYAGMLPCVDCQGIETEIKLNNDETYSFSKKYEGNKKIEHSETNGSFIWIDGSTIKLEDAEHKTVYYFVGENFLKQLDITGKEIKEASAEKYILKKQ